MVLFKTVRDISQISVLFRQMYPQDWRTVQKIYKEITSKPHSYLFIDLSQSTPEILRLRTDIFNKKVLTCYCPSDLIKEEHGVFAKTSKGKQIYTLHFK